MASNAEIDGHVPASHQEIAAKHEDTDGESRIERRIPFVLRVATEWTTASELRSPHDGQLRYWRRAPLTGNVTVTSHGGDISFSDMEVR
jgi:hypothetical protein